jgi:hypothetical protein
MNIILCILFVVIIVYAIYYCHNIKQYETFLTASQEDIAKTKKDMDNTINGLVNQLQILKENMPKTNKIIRTDFEGPNAFVPYVVNNMNQINKVQKENHENKHKLVKEKVDLLKSKINSFRDYLELESGREMKTIKSISSSQNGQPLTVIPVSNDKHLVVINNKCFSSNTVGLYKLDNCNYLDFKQHFKLNPVYHDIDYNINLAPSSKKVINSKDNNNKDVKYPFIMVKSHTNGNCLANTDGNVYLSPCNATDDFRWNPSTLLYQCKANDKNKMN